MLSRGQASSAPAGAMGSPGPGAMNLLVLGRKGAGKTSLVRERLARSFPRALVIDPFQEYADLTVQVRSMRQLEEYLRGADGRFKVSYWNTDLEDRFEAICTAVWNLGRITFFVEETDRWGGRQKVSPAFARIVKYGRHAPRGPVGLVAMCRFPAELPIMVRSQAWELDCFTLTEPAHLEWVSEVVEPEFVDGLNRLPPNTYRWKDLQHPQVPWQERRTSAEYRSRGLGNEEGTHQEELTTSAS